MTQASDPFWNEKNSWRLTQGNSCCFYCDGETYFKAFIQACESARRRIFILGWDTHSETNLDPGRERHWKGKAWSLGSFLRRILRQHPRLHIYMLAWRPAPLYILERQKLQHFRFTFFCHPRLHFSTAAEHPIGASHHEKIVIIDDALAFVGGMDLTVRRWDTCEHAANADWRKDPEGGYYQPYHDTQLALQGPAARELALIFRKRWQRTTGQAIPWALPHDTKSWPSPWAMTRLQGAPVAISLTAPPFREQAGLRQIAQLYEDLLGRAQNHVLIETQYLTSHHIVDVLCRLTQQKQGPEIILILPERLGPWLEKKTMSPLQASALNKIKAHDPYQRLRIFHPFDSELIPLHKYITVHSKLMIIDDCFLTLGSANLNNRSMGLDTECNVTIDARADPQLRAHIRHILFFLLTHYTRLGTRADIEAGPPYESLSTFIRLQALCSPDKHLARFALQPRGEETFLGLDPVVLDREQPSYLEITMERWASLLPPHLLIFTATALSIATVAALHILMPLLALVGFIGFVYRSASQRFFNDGGR